ncbi:sushi, von Willebrand factor type A, EGF and pentraxin domain-containing protein 1-like [Saccostrea cucullata]|uniref:sushi, von Willebrand factor type A, EGF and pentraxin domain-containing protein 1-like n=1 Tax=Saccostrea cuccullata TaxID=36930 RepID=UPI002ED0F401
MGLRYLFLCGFYISQYLYAHGKDDCLFCSQSVDTTRPRFINCPNDILVTADGGTRTKSVNWTEPQAIDARGGSVIVNRVKEISTQQPGDTFRGKTLISYTARDDIGNMATCSFTITVAVSQCSFPEMHDVIRHCDHYDTRYGTKCEFGCHHGYVLNGLKQIKCQSNGTWNGHFPTCEEILCPSLPQRKNGSYYTCTKGNRYGSECSVICPPGFDIPSGQERVNLCNKSGSWQVIIPPCEDILKPEIKNCTPLAYGIADENSTIGEIYWDEPYVYDNADKSIVLKKNGTISPRDKIEAGTHYVTYTAEDKTGNTARPCTVALSMRVLTCRRPYGNNFLSVNCPWGYRYGAQCYFSCRIGSKLDGPNITNCVRSKDGKYAYWDWGERQPKCLVHRSCAVSPSPPKNGAVVCDSWLKGKFCQVQCQKGYDFKPGYPFYEMLVCGDSGKDRGLWVPNNALPIPDCSKTLNVTSAKFKMYASFYYDGNCMDSVVQDTIRKNYIDSLSSSNFTDVCLQYNSLCNLASVTIECGATSRKRSADMKIIADFIIESDESESTPDFINIQSNMMDTLKNKSVNGSLVITLENNVTLTSNDLSVAKVTYECPENTFPSDTAISCLECSAGTHYNASIKTCLQCSKGHYQSSPGQPLCDPCPEGTTTKQVGAKSKDECLEACPPGYWSVTGVMPCSPCPLGSYAEEYGTSVCTSCPRSQTTLVQGSSEATDCTYFDILLSSSESKAIVDIKLTRVEEAVILSAWLRFPVGFNKISTPSLFFQNGDLWSEEILIEPKTNELVDNSSITIDAGKWNFIVFPIQIEMFNDSSIYENSSFTLKLTGPLTVSQLNIWSSNHTKEEVDNQLNRCIISDEGDVLSWKDWKLAYLEESTIQIPSLCDDINECDDHPCGNNTCINELGGFTCECSPGFRGERCEENIDECLTNICQNNSTCVDGINGYTCTCPPNYKGRFCESLFLNGNWSIWGEWSQCSETCGSGTKSRQRYCTNPAPYNGGKLCAGNDTEVTECFVQTCPVCTILEAPVNGSLNCSGTPDTGFNCTISCNRGYAFDEGVKPFYPWVVEETYNPNGYLPTCNPTKESKELTANFIAYYENLICDNNNHLHISTEIRKVVSVFLRDLSCGENKICKLIISDVIVLNCERGVKRKKREVAENPMTAGFKIQFTCSSIDHSSELCAREIVNAIASFKELSSIERLALNISAEIYMINLNQTSARGEIKCDVGYISSGVNCVPCGVGSFYSNGECRKCDYGFYQDELGQIDCKKCPLGTTTPGRASREIGSCSVLTEVHVEKTVDDSDAGIILGVTLGILIPIVLVVIFLFFKFKRVELKFDKVADRLKKTDNPLYDFNLGEEKVEVVAFCKMDENDAPMS